MKPADIKVKYLIKETELPLKIVRRQFTQGIGMVHQEFALIPDMTVGENIKLGRENTLCFYRPVVWQASIHLIDRKQDDESAVQTLKKLGINLDVSIKIIELSINLKQFVEIAREIDRTDLKLLILDEPTAVLNKNDGFEVD